MSELKILDGKLVTETSPDRLDQQIAKLEKKCADNMEKLNKLKALKASLGV